MLAGWVAILLKFSDESTQPGREHNQIAGIQSRTACVCDAGMNENRRPRTGSFRAVGIPERQFAFEDMPGLIVRMVNVESGGAASAPLMYFERRSRSRERHIRHLDRVPKSESLFDFAVRPVKPRQKRLHISRIHCRAAPDAQPRGRIAIRADIERHALFIEQ